MYNREANVWAQLTDHLIQCFVVIYTRNIKLTLLLKWAPPRIINSCQVLYLWFQELMMHYICLANCSYTLWKTTKGYKYMQQLIAGVSFVTYCMKPVQVSKCVNSFMTETKSQIIPQHIHQKYNWSLFMFNVPCTLNQSKSESLFLLLFMFSVFFFFNSSCIVHLHIFTYKKSLNFKAFLWSSLYLYTCTQPLKL